ncbi:hypothetical protein M758_1G108200 [Ceratodon purpureus]|nr:hypothetical protein M758_1G108200 [Ceratodon purpureus]
MDFHRFFLHRSSLLICQVTAGASAAILPAAGSTVEGPAARLSQEAVKDGGERGHDRGKNSFSHCDVLFTWQAADVASVSNLADRQSYVYQPRLVEVLLLAGYYTYHGAAATPWSTTLSCKP